VPDSAQERKTGISKPAGFIFGVDMRSAICNIDMGHGLSPDALAPRASGGFHTAIPVGVLCDSHIGLYIMATGPLASNRRRIAFANTQALQ